MKKRALILALAGIMAASLTGCGSLKDDAVVVKAGDEEITAGVANFYARYTQMICGRKMRQTARPMKNRSKKLCWMI